MTSTIPWGSEVKDRGGWSEVWIRYDIVLLVLLKRIYIYSIGETFIRPLTILVNEERSLDRLYLSPKFFRNKRGRTGRHEELKNNTLLIKEFLH